MYAACYGSGISDNLLVTVGLITAEYLKLVQQQFVLAIAQNSESKFHEAIDNHREILEWMKNFNKFFRVLVAVRCVSVALSICVIGFEIVEVRSFRYLGL